MPNKETFKKFLLFLSLVCCGQEVMAAGTWVNGHVAPTVTKQRKVAYVQFDF